MHLLLLQDYVHYRREQGNIPKLQKMIYNEQNILKRKPNTYSLYWYIFIAHEHNQSSFCYECNKKAQDENDSVVHHHEKPPGLFSFQTIFLLCWVHPQTPVQVNAIIWQGSENDFLKKNLH